MQIYRIETIVAKNREITVSGLPFQNGEKVEVIILSKPNEAKSKPGYSLRGQPIRYILPHDPVEEDDWGSTQ